MKKTTCIVDGCDAPVPAPGAARNMCSTHYKRWRRYGDASVVHPHGWRGDPLERFWSKVNKAGPIPAYRPDLGRCWIWTAALNKGYGVFWPGASAAKTELVPAHRYAYEATRGPIPDGLVIDHLCRVPACCNPTHLEPVRQRINILRGEAPAALHALKEECPEGHPYDLFRDGKRDCSTCNRIQDRERRERWRDEQPKAQCRCGCGEMIPESNYGGRQRQFKRGHNLRGSTRDAAA